MTNLKRSGLQVVRRMIKKKEKKEKKEKRKKRKKKKKEKKILCSNVKVKF